ncbi:MULTISPECIES: LPXTG cell wall anchor domain-containing protein [Enterococcus]|uniref:LPXTG cell wall anchor domain-containing protein n=1 Tax=Enterococcus TaxID=1350 RepID=UPI0015740B19|nr:LPXTG cell wall anchor domain-containing protein [Enterococcus faecium]EME3574581.1 LPXTG cell wall anchor domain-containing protein [Enterococcus faecium]EME8074466.1 LPXTG cell wall anchor domain-containing protein [Enterococcus faecium]EMF0403504.1 LPXTG cell wall anchor domain-containing protein [Enterococcus faecium]EMF0636005.1 LPXTG cell wall anchor domain-containing protein [Enterococcus faecium]NTK30314.1 LPXTG cell wall anchor domain-containing protein [Enterococcus faecium]
MKKMILSTLFSATLLMGTTGTFADTVIPEEPTTPPSGEITPPTNEGEEPTYPVLPPDTGDTGGEDTGTTPPDTGDTDTGGGDTGITPPDTGDTDTGGGDTGITPPDTGDTDTGGEDTGITPPDTGDTDTGGGDTGITPPDTGDTGTGGGDTGVTPPDTDTGGGNTGTTPPNTGDTNTNGENTGTMTPPTTNVGVNSDGSINHTGNSTQTTPIQTNNVSELTHIPTVSTPVETDTGEKIVSVVDGVPYKQTGKGLTPISANVTKLPSGNIAVKGSDGQLKVLPKTNEKATSFIVAFIGGILTSMSGWLFWKKRRMKVN